MRARLLDGRDSASSSSNSSISIRTSSSNSVGCEDGLQGETDAGGDGMGADADDGCKGNRNLSGNTRSRHIKLVALLTLAACIAYIGFLGGEEIGHIMEADSVPGHSARKSGHHAGGEIVDDSDIDSDEPEDENLDMLNTLRSYYKKHNADVLGDVPMILERYAGREHELFKKLEIKYGEPVLSSAQSLAVKESGMGHGEKRGKEGHEEEENEEEEKEEQDEEDSSRTDDVPILNVRAKRGSKESIRHVDDEGDIEEDEDESSSYDGDDDGSSSQHNEDMLEDETDDEEDVKNLKPDHGFDFQDEISTKSNNNIRKGKVKVIVVGFPGTGVDKVSSLLRKGYSWNALGADETCAMFVQIVNERQAEFNKFDRHDFIADDTVALYYQQLIATYPDAKILVTVRDVDSWYQDFSQEMLRSGNSDSSFLLRRDIYQSLLTKVDKPNEFLWKRKYQIFYDRLLSSVSRSKRKLVPVYDKVNLDKSWGFWVGKFLGKSFSPKILKEHHSSLRQGTGKFHSAVPDALTRLHHVGAEPSFSSGQLRILVMGVQGTGLDIVGAALHKLGYLVAHDAKMAKHAKCSHDCKRVMASIDRIMDGSDVSPTFGQGGVFQGVDAVVGNPAQWLVQEALASNPGLRVIVTVRNLESWWADLMMVCNKKAELANKQYYQEILYLASYVPEDRLLLFDVEKAAIKGDAWRSLCSFLRIRKCPSRSSFPAATKLTHTCV